MGVFFKGIRQVFFSVSCLCLFKHCELAKINRELKISSVLNPLAGRPNDSTVNLGLFENEIVQLLASTLNFTFEVIQPQDSDSGGVMRNGSWTGAIGQLIRKEIDIFTTSQGISHNRFAWADFSYPTRFEEMAIVTPPPTERQKTSVMVSTFSLELWVALVTTMAIVTLILWTLYQKFDASVTMSDWTLNFFSYTFGQDSYYRDRRPASRLIFAVWILSSFVIMAAYTARFTALLAIQQYDHLVHDLDELASRSDIKVYIVKGMTVQDFIMGSTEGSAKMIGDQLRRHPEQMLSVDRQAHLSRTIQGKAVMIQPKTSGESRIHQDYWETKECRLMLAKNTFYSTGYSMFMQKNGPITADINQQIIRLHESGLMIYAIRRSFLKSIPCKIKETKTKRVNARVLSKTDLSGAFILFLTGSALSALVFLLEKICKMCPFK